MFISFTESLNDGQIVNEKAHGHLGIVSPLESLQQCRSLCSSRGLVGPFNPTVDDDSILQPDDRPSGTLPKRIFWMKASSYHLIPKRLGIRFEQTGSASTKLGSEQVEVPGLAKHLAEAPKAQATGLRQLNGLEVWIDPTKSSTTRQRPTPPEAKNGELATHVNHPQSGHAQPGFREASLAKLLKATANNIFKIHGRILSGLSTRPKEIADCHSRSHTEAPSLAENGKHATKCSHQQTATQSTQKERESPVNHLSYHHGSHRDARLRTRTSPRTLPLLPGLSRNLEPKWLRMIIPCSGERNHGDSSPMIPQNPGTISMVTNLLAFPGIQPW